MEIAFEQIVALENQATNAATQHHYQEARQARLDALDIAKGMNRSRLTAVLFSRLGQVLDASGDVQSAVIAYESPCLSSRRANLVEVLRWQLGVT
jgi:hypothetical protein